jgi:SAM-dependent methyltransferase
MSGVPWDASYHGGRAPWDIGEPQPAIVRLAAHDAFLGAVLDAGCGTGENALYIASLGLSVVGVDVAPTAIAIAGEKARSRGIEAAFVTADAFELHRLNRTFHTVLDCGLFHTFDADERDRYLQSVAYVTQRGATLYVLCFSDEGPRTGPHPVSENALRAAFGRSGAWSVASVAAESLETTFQDESFPAWLATVKRL